MTWGGGGGGAGRRGKRLGEGGVCASDTELKPHEKASGVQEQKKSQLETFLPPNLVILLGRNPLGLKIECGLCCLGKDSLRAARSQAEPCHVSWRAGGSSPPPIV